MTDTTAWATRRLGELVTLTSGQSPSAFKFGTLGIPYYKVDQLGRSRKYLGHDSTPYFSMDIPQVPAGSVLIAKRGGAIALNRVRLIRFPSFMDTNVMALTPGNEIDAEFLYCWLDYRGLWDIADVTSVPQINNKHINPLEIELPTLTEQRRIVSALQEADDLIAVVERLIVKKQAIKQGMMQQLLAGRTRLPGFAKGWRFQRVSDLIDGLKAGVSVRSTAAATGTSFILKTSCVAGGKFIPTEAKTILPTDISRARCNPSAGSLIISRMNTPALVGEVGYVRETRLDLFMPDRLWVARAKPGTANDMRWLTYYFASRSGAKHLRDMATGTSGSMKNIPQGRVLSMEIEVPSCDEQRVIADVLEDADIEIELLDARLAKARAIKTGMMQQLLTGRVRLPAEAAT